MSEIRRTMRRHDVDGTARFLTFSCYQRLPLLSNDRVKLRLVHHLDRVVMQRGTRVLAWVIMPEHVHLVIVPGAEGVDTLLRSLKTPLATEVMKRWRELNAPILSKLRTSRGTNRFWQTGGGYDRVVVGDELLEKIRYCHGNPVKRGLCDRSIDWTFSSARAYERIDGAIGPEIAFDLLPTVDRPLT